MTFTQATTNPTQVETGIEFYLPSDDLTWIPNGFKTVSLTVDTDDLEDDYWITLDNAAEAWCDSNGYTFSQVLMEP